MTLLDVGGIHLSNKVILAPMSGVTDKPFRKIAQKYGVGLVVSEMIACRAMLTENKKILQKCDGTDFLGTSVQLAGCEPNSMAEAAKMNENMGAKIIDINFGCPAKKVVNGFAGSALMREEKLAVKILEAVVNAVNIPVTLKMRTGWDYDNRNAPNLAKYAEEAGIKMITIHGRTRCQFYSGSSDWNFIKQVKDAVKVPVIANGDIKSYQDVDKALELSGADGVMIGRGAYGKPWLPGYIAHYVLTGEQLPEPSIQEKYAVMIEHYEDILAHYGVEQGVKIARKHLSWYSAGLTNSSEFRASINRENEAAKVLTLIHEYFAHFL